MEAVVGERKVWIDFQLQQFPCQLLSTVCGTLLKQEPLFKMSFNTVWTGVLLQWTCMIDWLIYSGIDIYKLWMSSHTMLTRENCVDLNFVFQFCQISILCAIFFSVSANLFFRMHHLLSVSPNLSVMCHLLKISVSCEPSCETLLFEQTRESGAQSQVGALNIRLQKSLRNLTILLWTVWTNFYHNADQPCSFCRDESLKAHDYPLGWHGHGFLF